MATFDEMYDKIKAEADSSPGDNWQQSYAKPGPYTTALDPGSESQFQSWVKDKKIPFDNSPQSDYDMRGYWKDIASKGKSETSVNRNDNKPHFPDTYKTPFHDSFSNESKYAKPGAPSWNKQDQLVDKSGKVYYDEPARVNFNKMYDKIKAESHDGDTGAAAEASPELAMSVPGGQLGKFLQKPAQDAGKMLSDIINNAGNAAAQTAHSLSQGDVMSPIRALNTGVGSGLLGMADMLANPVLSAAEGLGAPHMTSNLAAGFRNMQAQNDPRIGQAMMANPAVGGVGEFAGGMLGPAPNLIKGTAGLGAKLAEAAGLGEAYGALGDISQRHQSGQSQDVLGSLYAGLGTALFGGGTGAALHGVGRATGARGETATAQPAEAPPQVSPERANVQAQIEALFGPQGTPPKPAVGLTDQPALASPQPRRRLKTELGKVDPSATKIEDSPEFQSLMREVHNSGMEAPPGESGVPPEVQMLIDSSKKASAPEDAKEAEFQAYKARVALDTRKLSPEERAIYDATPGLDQSQSKSIDAIREEMKAPAGWDTLSVKDLQHPEYAYIPGVKAGIRKAPGNKLEFVDKDGNVMKNRSGVSLKASYNDAKDTGITRPPLLNLIDQLQRNGHQSLPLEERVGYKKPATAEQPPTIAPEQKPLIGEQPAPIPEQKAPVTEQKPPIPLPAAPTEVEKPEEIKNAPTYEKWTPQTEEHKRIADSVDKERRFAKASFMQQAAKKGVSREESSADFNTKFNQQLVEKPTEIKDWLASHGQFRTKKMAETNAAVDQAVAKAIKTKRTVKQQLKELVADESGSSRPLKPGESPTAWLDPTIEAISNNHIADKVKAGMKHFEGEFNAQSLARFSGVQTDSDIVRQYDPKFNETRNKIMADMDRASVDVEDPRTQTEKAAWSEVAKTGTPSPDLPQKTNDYLQEFRKLSARYADQLTPKLEELRSGGAKDGLLTMGNDRLLKILQHDYETFSGTGAGKEKTPMEKFISEGRGGYMRSLFLGNQEIAGLHGIEAAAAGLSYDAPATLKATQLVSKAMINRGMGKADVVHDFMNAWKTKGMETHLQDSTVGNVPIIGDLVKAGNKVNDKIIKGFEKLPGGATFVDVARAQLPEKLKIQTLRVAMAVRQAGELKYPNGPEGLMKDILDDARGKQIAPDRREMLDKARLNMYSDLNRLVMYTPLGVKERTMFQRHGEMVQMLFPFTRSVIQQSRLIHSYGEDLIRSTKEAATGDPEGFGNMMQAVGRTGTMLGVLSLVAGGKAIPKEADEELRKHDAGLHKQLHEALDAIHDTVSLGQRVEHVQPKLATWNMQHGDFGGTMQTISKMVGDLKNPKTKDKARQRAIVMAASFAQIDNVFGLLGSQKAYGLLTKLGDGMKGSTTKYAYTEDNSKRLGEKKFKTNVSGEMLDWMLPGVPDNVSKWIEQKQLREQRQHSD